MNIVILIQLLKFFACQTCFLVYIDAEIVAKFRRGQAGYDPLPQFFDFFLHYLYLKKKFIQIFKIVCIFLKLSNIILKINENQIKYFSLFYKIQ